MTKKTIPKSKLKFETRAVRDGSFRSSAGEHSEALYITSSFIFESANQASNRFAGTDAGMIYSRFTNPSVQMFEERLASLEEGEACIATASGMSAILSVCLTFLKSGDEILTTPSLFGATIQLFDNILKKFDISITYVSLVDLEEWKNAITTKTKLIYLETPSNPLNQIADLEGIAKIARKFKILTVVDNCLCTPALQIPLRHGIDLVLHSATKFIDGQGRVLAGAIVGKNKLIDQIRTVARTSGPVLAPFNAWLLHKSLETLAIRMNAQSDSAKKIACWLEKNSLIAEVFYPGLKSHPQFKIAKSQQSKGGAIVSFKLRNNKEKKINQLAWNIIDKVKVFSNSANLGDTRSIITHPNSTTHSRISESTKEKSGVDHLLIRLSIGLENTDDLISDLNQALNQKE
jgi:O-succinylhomoserine sulfhydrylase